SGNDWNQTMFNDGLMQSLVESFGTVDTQAYRPAVVVLNGEYYGIQNIRERFDEYYFKTNYNIDENDLAILEYDRSEERRVGKECRVQLAVGRAKEERNEAVEEPAPHSAEEGGDESL